MTFYNIKAEIFGSFGFINIVIFTNLISLQMSWNIIIVKKKILKHVFPHHMLLIMWA